MVFPETTAKEPGLAESARKEDDSVLWFCCGMQFLGKLGPQAISCRLVYTARVVIVAQ